MIRRIYPRPPIVEAVIDLRLAAAVTGTQLLDVLQERLGKIYAGAPMHQQHHVVQVQTREDQVQASTQPANRITLLRTGDGLRLLGCGDGILSVHALAPYPGWENFLEQAKEAVACLPSYVRRAGARNLSVRYIDRILLPGAGSGLGDYLTIVPSPPEHMPQVLQGFNMATLSRDPNDGTVVSLTVASAAAANDGRPAVVYDLTVQRQGDPLCSLEDDSWVAIADALHTRQRDIFEASITDRMREHFQ
jgi:uncharacterized protein (TIGR04255 family)